MNTVLFQECVRYNRLLAEMAVGLKQVQKALVGEVVMSEDLEQMADAIYDNLVPPAWVKKGFLSLKPLASWIEDCNARIDFLSKWISGGTPHVYWISGLFFPQAFFTGNLQNFARQRTVAVDRLSFSFDFRDDITSEDVTTKPEVGCFSYGAYLEAVSGTMKHISSLNRRLRSSSWTYLCCTWCQLKKGQSQRPAFTFAQCTRY